MLLNTEFITAPIAVITCGSGYDELGFGLGYAIGVYPT